MSWASRAMPKFLSSFVNKIDAKGRISIPAPFRAELGEEKTIYCLPSLADPAIDVYTRAYLDEMTAEFKAKHGVNSLAFRDFQIVMSGDLHPLTIDSDGRIILPEELRANARITDQAVIAGADAFFQIWEPETRRAYRDAARTATRLAMYGLEGGRADRRSLP